MDINLIIAGLIIAIMGLPHGALDPVVAYRHGLIRNPLTASLFLGIYLIIAIAVIMLWMTFPQFTLIGFLVISALHFGRDWQAIINGGGFAYGAFVVGIPIIAHADEVRKIFDFLVIDGNSDFTIQLLYALFIIGSLLLSFKLSKLNRRQIIELIFISAAGILLSPLWYFVCFFCLLHSPRHLYSEFMHIVPQQRMRATFVMVIITLITIALALAFFQQQSVQITSLNQLIYQTIFIGLAALTVPHMCLLEWAGIKSKR